LLEKVTVKATKLSFVDNLQGWLNHAGCLNRILLHLSLVLEDGWNDI